MPKKYSIIMCCYCYSKTKFCSFVALKYQQLVSNYFKTSFLLFFSFFLSFCNLCKYYYFYYRANQLYTYRHGWTVFNLLRVLHTVCFFGFPQFCTFNILKNIKATGVEFSAFPGCYISGYL